MKTFMNYAVIAALLLSFAGCSKDNDLQTENDGSSSALKSTVIKTIKIHNSSGIMDFIFSPDNPCFAAGFAQASITGSGNATHLGKFNLESHFCVNEQGLPTSSMNGSLTAANGDKILIFMEDPSTGFYFDPNDGLFHMEFTVVGGTGRFANATGNISNWGHVDFVNKIWDFKGEGTITCQN